MWSNPFVIVLIIVVSNVVGYLLIGFDKQQAPKRNAPRVPEKVLLLPVLLGGIVGVLYGMKHFRHKTRKQSFQIKLWAVFVASLYLGYIVLFQSNSFLR